MAEISTPHASLPVPDYCEPLVAWRTWQRESSTQDLPRLVSSFNMIWEPYQRFEAKHRSLAYEFFPHQQPELCQSSPCDAWNPHHHYGCGIYGVKTREQLKGWLNASFYLYTETVIGQVYLWGNIIEHERGYRAQYAYPKCIVYTEKNATMLTKIYGIPYEEDLSWTSVIESNESLPSLYSYLSQYLPSRQLSLQERPGFYRKSPNSSQYSSLTEVSKRRAEKQRRRKLFAQELQK